MEVNVLETRKQCRISMRIKFRYVSDKTSLIMHWTRVSPNKGSSAVLTFQNGCHNAQRRKLHNFSKTKDITLFHSINQLYITFPSIRIARIMINLFPCSLSRDCLISDITPITFALNTASRVACSNVYLNRIHSLVSYQQYLKTIN